MKLGLASGGRLLHELDLVAELFEPVDMVVTDPSRVAPGEVVGPEVVVGYAVLEHMPPGPRASRAARPRSLSGAAARFQAVVERAVVALLGPDGRPGRLLQGCAQPGGPLAGGGRPALARTLMVARTQARPGRELLRGGEDGPCPRPSRPASPARHAWPRRAWSAPARRPRQTGPWPPRSGHRG